jgi:hypothetical protein
MATVFPFQAVLFELVGGDHPASCPPSTGDGAGCSSSERALFVR